MNSLITKINFLILLSGFSFAITPIVVDLPPLPLECKLLNDAVCVFDSKVGKYVIVQDSTEIDNTIYTYNSKDDKTKKFDNVQGKVIIYLEKRILEATKFKECVLSSDTLDDLKICSTLKQNSSINRLKKIKQDRVKKVSEEIKKLNEELNKREDFTQNKGNLESIKQELDKKESFRNCILESNSDAQLKRCDLIYNNISISSLSNKSSNLLSDNIENFDYKKSMILNVLNKRVSDLKKRVKWIDNYSQIDSTYKSKIIFKLNRTIDSIKSKIECNSESSNYSELKNCNNGNY